MKKIIFIVIISCLAINMHAQEARGHCKVPGTNDYVEIVFSAPAQNTANSPVHFMINNSSTRPLLSVKIVIKADLAMDRFQQNEYTNGVTLYEDYIDIEVGAFKSKSVNFNLSTIYYGIKNIKATISNPSCVEQ